MKVIHIPNVTPSCYDPPGYFRQMAIRASLPGAWNLIGRQEKVGGKQILRWCWPKGGA